MSISGTGIVFGGREIAAAVAQAMTRTSGTPDERAPRRHLIEAPSPVQRMRRLELEIGASVELYVKREDALRPLYGNKLRYIEYVLGALDLVGADCLLHCGGPTSNYLGQLAMIGAEAGLAVHLVVTADEPETVTGNPLIMQTMGARLRWQAGCPCSAMKAAWAAELAAAGRRAMVIDAPFTNHSSILGYMRAWREITSQVRSGALPQPDHIVLCSAGNSYLGLRIAADMAGAEDWKITAFSSIRFADAGLAGIAASREAFLLGKAEAFASWCGERQHTFKVDVDESAVGPGYPIPSAESIAAVRLVGRTEGILLDPIYTGKAMAGLLDGVRKDRYPRGSRILFMHSGGWANAFTFNTALSAAA